MKTRPGTAIYNPPGTAGGTAAKWDSGIHSLTDFVAVATVNLTAGAIRAWINDEDGTEQVWRLYAGGAGLLPNDYNAVTNNVSWFKAST